MTATEWIEEFTGLKVPGGEPTGKDLAAEADALEREAAMKQALLADVRQVLDGVKADFQRAMQIELKTKGAFFKQKLLEVEGTQMDEADFTEIDFHSLKLSPDIEAVIAKGKNTIINQNGRLQAAIAHIQASEASKTDVVVQSNIKQLEEKLLALERLVGAL